jgi:tetratricopeptide (TPR) repeat protein
METQHQNITDRNAFVPAPLQIICPAFEKRIQPCKTFALSVGRSIAQLLLMIGTLFSVAARCPANELDDARSMLRAGKYSELIDLAKSQVDKRVWNEAWPRLLIEGYLFTGRIEEAKQVYESSLERFGDSLRLRLLGAKVLLWSNEAKKSDDQLNEIESIIQRTPWRFSNRSDLVPLGEFFLMRGEDPKQVLKICFDQAIKADPKNVEPYVATARMALDKNDAQVASQSLKKAMELDPNDPEVFFLAARAWSSDEEKATGYLKRSIELNSKYIPSILLAAESRMNAEDYTTALVLLDQIEQVNASQPKMWAMRAAIAHLRGEFENEGNARRKGLESWKLNPEVDYTIGKHLSLHYRFAEGVEYQRRALTMDSKYAPARTQLAQDLLRSGEDTAGWEMVEGIRQTDPYDVSIFNLKQLQSKLSQFTTIETDGFVIRMEKSEAEVYGRDVVELLQNARQVLVPKYGATLQEPIFVEIFPRQQEFAIRTFGMPGGQGFLGVCFGRLITANSPSALQVDSNWKSVLWHEYCHVVTLQKTKNKMPRWLSEGISVYEERCRDSTWGERLDPIYREMLISEDLVPISQLSSAFQQPKSPLHLQFAYYASSLAVEFWIERWGVDGLRRLLEDLSIGMKADEALARLPGSLAYLDAEFLEFARERARSFTPNADFTKPTKEEFQDLDAWMTSHPNSYWGLKRRVDKAIEEKAWNAAVRDAESLASLWPEDHSETGVYSQLAAAYRGMEDAAKEYEALRNLEKFSPAPRSGLLRLIEIDSKRNEWESVAKWVDRMQGIQPMRSDTQTPRALAAEKTLDNNVAIRALEALATMDPVDPANIYYRLANALYRSGDLPRAKRYCLMALEEAPRYSEALKLLLQLQDDRNQPPEVDLTLPTTP